MFYFADTEKSRIFAPMKHIISTIAFLLLGFTATAQDVVRLLEPVYADSGSVYRQSVYVPQKWEKRQVMLFLERPLGATTVRVNGVEVSGDTVLYMPHQLDVTKHIVAGQRNTIEVAVAGHDAHGVMGSIELRSKPRGLYIDRLKMHPRPFMGTVRIEVDLRGQSPYYGFFGLQTMIQREDVDTAKIFVNEHEISSEHMEFDVLVMDNERLWDEFHPNTFRLAVSVGNEYQEYTFGMREAGVVDGQLFLNRHPVYLRGVMMDDYFPLSGRMPMDVATWKHIFERLSAFGLNHVRFRGYCPPDAAFIAADKVGMYLQPEARSAADMNRIADTFGHHPSLVLIALGQEDYVFNDRVITPVTLNQQVIMGSDVLAYKQGVEGWLLSGGVHYLLGGLCDRQGDLSGVLHERWDENDNGLVRQFNQFCRAIVPLVKLPQREFAAGDTLRVPVYIYNAMYGNLHGVRTSYYLVNADNKVLAGGLVASGDVALDSIPQVGEVVLPIDSIKCQGPMSLTITVGSSAVRNRWDLNINE